MRKYPIKFVTDYYILYKDGQYEGELWEMNVSKKQKEKSDFCKKWRGKSMTLLDVENRIDEMGGRIIFDGVTITIYNDYNE